MPQCNYIWESPSSDEYRPSPSPQPAYLSPSTHAPRYCEANDGCIEVINDGEAIGLNEGKKRLVKKGRKARLSPEIEDEEEQEDSVVEPRIIVTPPVYPSAPLDIVIHATLSRRLKSPHHTGGWHGRTMLESKAANKLRSFVKEDIGDVLPIIAELVTKSTRRTLQRIIDHDDEIIRVYLKAIVRTFNAGNHGFKVKYQCTEIKQEDSSEGSETSENVKKEELKEEFKEEDLLKDESKEELKRALALVEESLPDPKKEPKEEAKEEERLAEPLSKGFVTAAEGSKDYPIDLDSSE